MISISDLDLPDVKHIQFQTFVDERGFFVEIYRKSTYEEAGISTPFLQDNYSFSKRGTIRGMHFQTIPGQAKLITVLSGTIYDVFVDIRPDSPTFKKWGARELDAKRHEQLYIPVGFAHGFAVLSESAQVIYKVSSFFDRETEKGFRFDDPELGIFWPIETPILSEKDRVAPLFRDCLKDLFHR